MCTQILGELGAGKSRSVPPGTLATIDDFASSSFARPVRQATDHSEDLTEQKNVEDYGATYFCFHPYGST